MITEHNKESKTIISNLIIPKFYFALKINSIQSQNILPFLRVFFVLIFFKKLEIIIKLRIN